MATRRSSRVKKPTGRKVESDMQLQEYNREHQLLRSRVAECRKRRRVQFRDDEGEVYQQLSDYGDLEDYQGYLPTAKDGGAPVDAVQPSLNAWIVALNKKPDRAVPLRLRWDRSCSYCGCNLLSTERDGWCCRKGKWTLEPLSPIPEYVHQAEATEGETVGSMSRRLNNLFAISGIGVDSGSFIKDLGYNSNVILNGRTYHRLQGLAEGEHSLRWFLYDEEGRRRSAAEQKVPEGIVAAWRDFLREHNHYVERMEAASLSAGDEEFEVVLDDSSARGEIAAIYSTINMQSIAPRTIVFRRNACEPAFLDILSSHYEPMQYPVLFPRGEPGWSTREPLTQAQWYRRRILMEPRFFTYHRLAQEYCVDMWSRIEDERIHMIKRGKEFQLSRNPTFHQVDASNGDPNRVRESRDKWHAALPASFLGSEAWTREQVQDAMTLCKEFGNPTIFLTMTTNPDWPEIRDKLQPGQHASDIPWTVVRVFHEKMKQMLKILEKASGGFRYLISVVEFQKRGYPHCHVLLQFRNKFSPADVDNLVSAELPTEAEDPELRRLVLAFNMHPTTHLQRQSRCNRKGKCSFGFPRPIREHTEYDAFGRASLRRRKAEDAWVCPYIPALTRLMQCHIYLDVPHNVSVVFYLYKYFFKGPDKAKISITAAGGNAQSQIEDESQRRIRGRWVSASEACWRIFTFSVSIKRPSVHNLRVHLPGANLGSMSRGKKASTSSQLLYYLMRPLDNLFNGLTYTQYYARYVRKPHLNAKELRRPHWQEEEVIGNPQPANYIVAKKKQSQIVGVALVPVQTGELFYLRMLLCKVPARSFEDLRTVDGVVYRTFQEACDARGLLLDKDEAAHALQELIDLRYSPQHLRFVMAQLLVDLGAPGKLLWERFKDKLVLDFADKVTVREKEDAALKDLQRIVRARGFNLDNFGLPSPRNFESALDRELEVLREELETNTTHYRASEAMFNPEQAVLFRHLQSRVENPEGACLFVDGRAGRGKSFVLQAFVSWCRSQDRIVMVVGSTALSVLAYPRGRTAHSAFMIPVEKESIELASRIVQDSDQWRFLEAVSVIIWEELPMINRSVLECVQILLKPMRPAGLNRGFGNVLFIGTGDFRQVAPVLKKGTRTEIIDASVKESWIWPWFEMKTLETPVRFGNDVGFSTWLDDVGDGKIPVFDFEDQRVIKLASCNIVQSADEASRSVFPDDILRQPHQCLRRAILSPINVTVDEHNERVLCRLPSPEVVLYGYNHIKEDSEKTRSPDEEAAIEEWLAMIRDPSAPPQELRLKPGCVCALMRNLSLELGLVKNVRVVVQSIAKHSVTVHTIGNGAGDETTHVLPRINFEFQPMWSFYTVCRRQFPLRLAYATTFNSCQGLTLDRVVLDMGTQPFAHGQLYTAVSRVRRSSDMAILNPLLAKDSEALPRAQIGEPLAVNVVYQELLT